ncbi:SMC family ATPase [Microbacterium sp. dk485]|uniref:AAA family ATPase n=1 Tax=Microbacterium sp. dk485 TaxID=2560021 RepID=UPI00107357A4|nr:SMC family ATPase [Microbacterium sp. dk485]TFV85264.1 SMC family ATPase [Microbacterium sp. dk485]
MKLHRLELAGFGPFRDRQVVDFDAFADDGIFLISGRTGAGKSSVLDGVCYALFGGVPRYDGGERRLRSDHCDPEDPTQVVLEFTAGERRWRVTRSPEYERPKLRGGGFTTEPHRAMLEEFDGVEWTGVAARPVDVAAHLDEIVGLTQQQFLQVILLAQNRFARFLLARNDERQALLRTLFGTRTYEQYAEILEGMRKDAEAALLSEGENVRMLLEEAERVARDADVLPVEDPAPADIPARLSAVVRAAERAAYRAEVAAQEQRTAETGLDGALERERDARELAERQRQRLELRERLARLTEDAPAVDAEREVLARARAGEELRAALEAADRAERDAAVSAERAAAATVAWAAAGETASTPAQLRSREDELAAVLAACADALAAETELAEAEREVEQAAAAAADAERAVAALDAQRAAVPALLRDLDDKLEALAAAPAERATAEARLTEAERRRDAAREAETLVDPLRAAERRAVACGIALAEATAHHTSLLQRRLASAAGDLAAGLVQGEPCPVCGGTEHPHTASPSDEPVSDAAIEDAALAKETALAEDRRAAEALRDAGAAHAAAVARAGGTGPEETEADCDAARAARDAAEERVATAERLAAERAGLAAADADAAAGREALVAEAAQGRQDAALATQRAHALRARVDGARGDAATVAERRDDAERRRELLRALTDSAADSVVRAEVLSGAAAHRDERLAASIFDDADAARAALRPAGERAAMEDRVRAHDDAERSARQRLLELELVLVDQPEQPADLGPVQAELAHARARVTAAAAATAEANAILTRLRDLAERADAAHRAIADTAARAAVVGRLAHTVAGRAPNTRRMTLETFVLAAELEEIVAAANLRLADMSAGRYRLQHSDALAARGAASGLGLEVLDSYTGQARPPQSLSGGETFLASLALALGLAEVVTARAGGIRLDTLFIDEGFGSLDDDTLELAMRALDELRQGGRTVGVISHVAAMKEQLPAQLLVEAGPQGASVIRQGAAVGS